MRTNGYSEDTITRYERFLTTLLKRGTDLLNSENVKRSITNQKWNDGTKQEAVNAIKLFYKLHNINHNTTFPKYQRPESMVFIPLEQELDQLIAGCKHRLSTLLQILKETAMRYGEALRLTWQDYDIERLTLSVNHPEKGSNARAVKISVKLATMINMLPHDNETILNYASKECARKNFQRARKRISKNLCNPRLLQIHFHTFRHWKATTLLHQTNNVHTVMKFLGHKCLNNTQRYIHLLPEISDDYVCEIATTTEQVKKLVENGFDYVQTINGTDHIYRKRK
jgi:integrase